MHSKVRAGSSPAIGTLIINALGRAGRSRGEVPAAAAAMKRCWRVNADDPAGRTLACGKRELRLRFVLSTAFRNNLWL